MTKSIVSLFFLLATVSQVFSSPAPDPNYLCGLTPSIASKVASLVSYVNASVTDTMINSGKMSDATTWSNGLPASGTSIEIAPGVVAEYDLSSATFTNVYVLGTLNIDSNTTMIVNDTLLVNSNGALIIGNSTTPASGVSIIFSTVNPINPLTDTAGQLRKGLVVVDPATFAVYGVPKTAWLPFAGANQGDTTINLDQAPNGWQPGDTLVVTGDSTSQPEDQLVTLGSIAGNTIVIDPLKHDKHPPTVYGGKEYVGNLTRSVNFSSLNNVAPGNKNPAVYYASGHDILMSRNVHIEYAAFDHMGRTDKMVPISSPSNVKGRYAIHFHVVGTCPTPIEVTGTVVTHTPGWGFVNHASFVNFDNDISYDVSGSGFATEFGNEMGGMTGNLAVHDLGSGDGQISRAKIFDFGHGGNGFWLSGTSGIGEAGNNTGFDFSGNVANTTSGSGIYDYALPILSSNNVDLVKLLCLNTETGVCAKGVTYTFSEYSPIHMSNIVSFAAGLPPLKTSSADVAGLSFYGLSPHQARNTVNQLLTWNTLFPGTNGKLLGHGDAISYCTNVDLRNVIHLGNPSNPAGVGSVETIAYDRNFSFTNMTISGFAIAIFLPADSNGTYTTVNGGTFSNNINVFRLNGLPHTTTVFTGNINLIQNTTTFSYTENLTQFANVNAVFAQSPTFLNFDSYTNQELFPADQMPNFVPFPASNTFVPYPPIEVVGLTNQQLWNKFGTSTRGFLPSSDVVMDPSGTFGIGSKAIDPPAFYFLNNSYWTTTPKYPLIITDSNGNKTTRIVNLAPGWNDIVETINGASTRAWVLLDNSALAFSPSPKTVWTVHKTDTSFLLTGTLYDNFFSQLVLNKSITLNPANLKNGVYVGLKASFTHQPFKTPLIYTLPDITVVP